MIQQKLPQYLNQQQQQQIYTFAQMIQDWQKSINLISKTQNYHHIWERHILDCCRILPIIEECNTKISNICDLGSGAGFPGIIIAIAKQDINVHLIEHKNKKCLFLQHVISKLNLKNAVIHPCRIEQWRQYNQDIEPDIITARALAPMEKILPYLEQIKSEKTIALLFCGNKKISAQLQNAKTKWQFNSKIIREKQTKSNVGPIIKIERLQLLDKAISNNIQD